MAGERRARLWPSTEVAGPARATALVSAGTDRSAESSRLGNHRIEASGDRCLDCADPRAVVQIVATAALGQRASAASDLAVVLRHEPLLREE